MTLVCFWLEYLSRLGSPISLGLSNEISCVEAFIDCMFKNIQSTICSKSGTLHTFHLYGRILHLGTTFQEDIQNYSWNINHTLKRKHNLEVKVILTYYILTFIYSTQRQTGLYLSRLKKNFTSDYFSWAFSLKFPSTASFFWFCFFFPFLLKKQVLSFTVWLGKRR